MTDHLLFATRAEFRGWLQENCLSSGGIWLLFGKTDGPKTIKANEALEEALCFGWIDGQMKRIDATTYLKYFSMRRPNSKWSDKNKALAEMLEKQGVMTVYGRAKIAEAQKNGQWEACNNQVVTDAQVAMLSDLLKGHETALLNFQAMSPSVKRTYARGCQDGGRTSETLGMDC